MKLTRPARAAQSETIIALIDVVFFLLIFFMLIGRMDATAPFEVTPPHAETGRDMPAGGITLAISAKGALALDGDDMRPEDLPDVLSEHLQDNPDLRLRINAHRAAELRNVLPLVSRAQQLGFRDVVLVVTPETGG
ncbi:biopolymer transporter ExbD [Phaeobacter gallaeciensis]|uniref:ExbD/TolR family protein n=1 Tax=Phaeobacter gallaeciensis TaxID=60890 RepID=UPI00237FBC82|nr:biopolymer transporter ExbD [Phaeobacter gallaeciensis]MEC9310119.1 biopolymer transporter ExbD [Pseudomonadota bacterium]MDE4097186.1 biopolymer transporter ExbD [Phaeobacter gallaeciensis]MDE4106300.1 biopolymer transporter ExbD [Phaeobacter gallaeciensis]MDE4112898.1 biopolymer transporter ExbD [Phaeobacter gallaeciensis]MDE4114921.1 biopolymer transporter ExbD [Phaeobacter gallaeciensis]